MALLVALAWLAAATTSGGDQRVSTPASSTKAMAPAQAFVRILPGARIALSSAPQPDGHQLSPATVTVEDGSRRSAQLVEFQ